MTKDRHETVVTQSPIEQEIGDVQRREEREERRMGGSLECWR